MVKSLERRPATIHLLDDLQQFFRVHEVGDSRVTRIGLRVPSVHDVLDISNAADLFATGASQDGTTALLGESILCVAADRVPAMWLQVNHLLSPESPPEVRLRIVCLHSALCNLPSLPGLDRVTHLCATPTVQLFRPRMQTSGRDCVVGGQLGHHCLHALCCQAIESLQGHHCLGWQLGEQSRRLGRQGRRSAAAWLIELGGEELSHLVLWGGLRRRPFWLRSRSLLPPSRRSTALQLGEYELVCQHLYIVWAGVTAEAQV